METLTLQRLKLTPEHTTWNSHPVTPFLNRALLSSQILQNCEATRSNNQMTQAVTNTGTNTRSEQSSQA